jgi:hypothetical protein
MMNQGDMRVGDAERDAAATRLREHFAAGRLTLDEFRDRLAAAFAATTSRELGLVTADLPYNGISPTRAARTSGARTSGARTSDARSSAGGGGRRRHHQPHAPRSRRTRLRFRSRLLLACAAIAALWLLIGISLPHNGLLIAALLLMLGLMGLVVGGVVGLVWFGRRALRRAAWLEGLPLLVGAPWLGRTAGAGRTVWAGRTLWLNRYERTAARNGTTR